MSLRDMGSFDFVTFSAIDCSEMIGVANALLTRYPQPLSVALLAR